MIKQIMAITIKRFVLVCVIFTGSAIAEFAQSSQNVATVVQPDTNTQTMTLQAFALTVEKVFKSEVLIDAEDADSPVRIRKNTNELDYSALLTQLKQNGFTAYKSGGNIHFVQIRHARHSATPVVEKNKTYFDDEYVTEYIKLEKACSDNVLATLRPLVPQDSHVAAAHNPEILLLSDTYSNIQRIKAVIKSIEGDMEKPAVCSKD